MLADGYYHLLTVSECNYTYITDCGLRNPSPLVSAITLTFSYLCRLDEDNCAVVINGSPSVGT